MLARLAGASRTLHQGLHRCNWRWHASSLRTRHRGGERPAFPPIPVPGDASEQAADDAPGAETAPLRVPFDA
eukprot:9872513-Alexandrium_andersonii.AAC.1